MRNLNAEITEKFNLNQKLPFRLTSGAQEM